MTSDVLRGGVTGPLGTIGGGGNSLTVHGIRLGVISLFTVNRPHRMCSLKSITSQFVIMSSFKVLE